MIDKVLPIPVVLVVGDVYIEGDVHKRIHSGKLTVDADTGAYLEMDGCVLVDIIDDDATIAWEDGHQVFEVAPDDDFIGLWAGC